MKTNKLFRHIIRTGLTSLFAFVFLFQEAFWTMPQAIAEPIEPEPDLTMEVIEKPSLAIIEPTANQTDVIADIANNQSDAAPEVIENTVIENSSTVIENSVEGVTETAENLLVEIAESADNQPSSPQESISTQQTTPDQIDQNADELPQTLDAISADTSDILGTSDSLTESDTLHQRDVEVVTPTKVETQAPHQQDVKVVTPTKVKTQTPHQKDQDLEVVAPTKVKTQANEIIQPTEEAPAPPIEETPQQVIAETEAEIEQPHAQALPIPDATPVGAASASSTEPDAGYQEGIDVESVEPETVATESSADKIKPPAEETLTPQVEEQQQVIAKTESKGEQSDLEQTPPTPDAAPADTSNSLTETKPSNQSEVEIVKPEKVKTVFANKIQQPDQETLTPSVEEHPKQVIAEIESGVEEIDLEQVPPISDPVPDDTSDSPPELDPSNQQTEVEIADPVKAENGLVDKIQQSTEEAPPLSVEASARAEMIEQIKEDLQELGAKVAKATLDLTKFCFELIKSWLNQLFQDKG